jgi:hypothetical protein
MSWVRNNDFRKCSTQLFIKNAAILRDVKWLAENTGRDVFGPELLGVG